MMILFILYVVVCAQALEIA